MNVQGWVGNSSLDLEGYRGRELSRIVWHHFQYENCDTGYLSVIGWTIVAPGFIWFSYFFNLQNLRVAVCSSLVSFLKVFRNCKYILKI